MILVETLMNFEIYACNVHIKKHRGTVPPFIIISDIVPNNTRIYVILKVPS